MPPGMRDLGRSVTIVRRFLSGCPAMSSTGGRAKVTRDSRLSPRERTTFLGAKDDDLAAQFDRSRFGTAKFDAVMTIC
jgi:hypothetical protein